MACGHVPFDAENFLGILTQHMYKAPPPLRKSTPAAQHISPALEAIILKCLSKRQDQRYQAMDEILADLDRLEAGEIPDAVSDLKNRTDEFAVPEDYFRSDVISAGSASNVVLQRRRSWLLYTGVAALLAAVAIVSALLAQMAQSDDTSEALVPSEPTESPPPKKSNAPAQAVKEQGPVTPSRPRSEETTIRQVALATEPLDAQVFLDGKSIGSSPVLVEVAEGHQARLEIRRAGYKSRDVTIDGTEGRLSVRLEKVATSPAKPAGRPSGVNPARCMRT